MAFTLETMVWSGGFAALALASWVTIRVLFRAKLNRHMLSTLAQQRGGEMVRADRCCGRIACFRGANEVACFRGANEEVQLWLSSVSRWRWAALQMSVPWPNDDDWLSLRPLGILYRLTLWERRSRHAVRELGYWLRASHVSWGRRLIDGGVASRLQQINALQGGRRSTLQISDGRLSLTLRVPVGAGDRLRQLVDISLELVDQAGLQERGEIQVVTPERDPEEGASHCPVCSGALVKRVVYCLACGAPHHRDCWRYVGRCSMFGCSGTRIRSFWNRV